MHPNRAGAFLVALRELPGTLTEMGSQTVWVGVLLGAACSALVPLAACGGINQGEEDCTSYACFGDDDASTSNPDGAQQGGDSAVDAEVPFEPALPTSYVNKVKTILTGLAATDAEVAAVIADPGALRGLIDTWMALPEFERRAKDFFRTAFQQSQIGAVEVFDAHGQGTTFLMNETYRGRLNRTLMDSFGRTVWALVQEGKPLSTALTTDSYQLTTAELVMLTYLDEVVRSDQFGATNRLNTRVDRAVTFDPAIDPPFAQSIDPDNANFMRWKARATPAANCTPIAETFATNNGSRFLILLRSFFGSERCRNDQNMGQIRNVQVPPILTDDDFEIARPVRIERAAQEGDVPYFWELPRLRSATTLKLHTPRVGFLGTLAFAANWPTNAGNDARVIVNQALIVGLGRSINGESSIVSFPEGVSDSDQEHSANPACAVCHVQLEPMKQFVKQSLTLYYSEQRDPAQISAPASFAVDGVTVNGSGVGDLMKAMTQHPRFPIAWTHKLYFWATSHPAHEDDPEFLRVAEVFRQNNFDFKVLVRELFASPLITYASRTMSTTMPGGDALSIARRDQYCAALSNRLGLSDVCGISSPAPNASQRSIAQSASMIAADGYFRSFELPALPTTPDLFFRASAEAMCGDLAALVVDAGDDSRYKSTAPEAAIDDMVTVVMGLPPSNPRAAGAKQILLEHFNAARALPSTDAGADAGTIRAVDALKSTFQLACLSPSSVIVGL